MIWNDLHCQTAGEGLTVLSQLQEVNTIQAYWRGVMWKGLPGSWDVSDGFKNAGAAGEDQI